MTLCWYKGKPGRGAGGSVEWMEEWVSGTLVGALSSSAGPSPPRRAAGSPRPRHPLHYSPDQPQRLSPTGYRPIKEVMSEKRG